MLFRSVGSLVLYRLRKYGSQQRLANELNIALLNKNQKAIEELELENEELHQNFLKGRKEKLGF